MDYDKIFTPTDKPAPAAASPGDPRQASVYVYNDQIVLAVNVALATARPLLVAGPPGSGKSSVAANVANEFGWRYYEQVISSRTEAQDLLWQFDALARLRDAQAGVKNLDAGKYVEAAVLWRAFDQESARPYGSDPQTGERAVVLLDEIDKADPDVPNNLLVPLGSFEFKVTDLDLPVKASNDRRPLVILTTNDERELPAAFTRRCIVLTLESPTAERFVAIAGKHFPGGDSRLHKKLADMVVSMAGQAEKKRVPPPSTAEYIDAIRACEALKVKPGTDAWEAVAQATLSKRRELAEALA
jgi:MoxR-like ATPase